MSAYSGEREYIDDLKSIAPAYGYDPHDIDAFLHYGMCPEEIEELMCCGEVARYTARGLVLFLHSIQKENSSAVPECLKALRHQVSHAKVLCKWQCNHPSKILLVSIYKSHFAIYTPPFMLDSFFKTILCNSFIWFIFRFWLWFAEAEKCQKRTQ